MEKQLIIAEKPIAAERIATFLSEDYGWSLGRKEFTYKDATVDYYVLDGRVYVIPLEGHLVQPQAKRARGYPNFDWELRAPRRGRRKARWELIKKLASEDTDVIGATDNDEEGEVMLMYSCNGLGIGADILLRMRFVELTPKAIAKAYQRAVGGEEYLNMQMAYAGHARHLLDLWYGKNVSHLFSEGAIQHGAPPQIKFWLGRVKVPMLTYLGEERVKVLTEPKEATYGEAGKETEDTPMYTVRVHLDFYGDEEVSHFEVTADEISGVLEEDWHGEVTEVTDRERVEGPPREVYDTDGITSEASEYGISATKVMPILQMLYQMGLISYPRTPSKKLKEDIEVNIIISSLAEAFDWVDEDDFEDFVELEELHESPESPHVGLYPTGKIPTEVLPDEYLVLWELIARRFLTALAKPSKEKVRDVTVMLYRDDYEHEKVKVSFSEVIDWGYKKYQAYRWSRTTNKLPEVEEGERTKVWLAVETETPETGSRESVSLEAKVPEVKKVPVAGYGGVLRWMDWEKLGTEATRSGHVGELLTRGYATGEEALTLTAMGQRLATLCKEHIPLTLEDTKEMHRMVEAVREGYKSVSEALDEARQKVEEIYGQVDIYELGEKLNDVGNCIVCGAKARLVFFVDRQTGRPRYFVGCSRYPECKFLLPIS